MSSSLGPLGLSIGFRRLCVLGATFSATSPVPTSALPTPLVRDPDGLEAIFRAERASSAQVASEGQTEVLERRGKRKAPTTTSDGLPSRTLPRPLGRGTSNVNVRRATATSAGNHSRRVAVPVELNFTLLQAPASPRSALSDSDERRYPSRDIILPRPRSSRPTGAVLFSSNVRILPRQPPRPNHSRPLSTLLRPTPAVFNPSVHDQDRPKPNKESSASLAGMDVGGREDFGASRTDHAVDSGEKGGQDGGREGWTPSKSSPSMDEINTLLRHPALYDPVLKPRFPIVLCHGLYGFDVRGPTYFRLHYWGDLLKILRGTVGAEVFVTAVPGTGSIKHRAHALHDSLEETRAIHGKDLNFLAHSMGGLDARYLLSSIRPTTYRPRSLTTLSTPHRGSEFMAWCRANIGIGTEFDKTSEAAARAAHEDTNDPLPFSLKSPLLSRAQVEAAKQAAEASKKAQDAADKVKAAINFPGLPYSLSASVSAYLLDLLDSPAYANLTPSFLREVFNPLTPNRDDIRYYSVASRTDRIPVWHPLWLPKQVLDGAEAARRAQGIEIEERWRGNDGLVTIESAKWGEFLGVVENCDHWEMRGSSGLVSAAASAKAVAEVTRLAASSEGNVKTKGWQWQDLYSLVGTNQSKRSTTSRKEDIGAASVEKVEKATSTLAQSEDAKGLASFATWIVRHLPGIPSTSTPPDDMASNTDLPNIAGSSPPLPGLSKSPSSASPSARMLYGAPASSPAKPDKFNLEQMALAICRKLHNEGL